MIAVLGRTVLSATLALAAVPAVAASRDATFAMQAAQGGLAEVQMGKLALSKSKNATVRAFAQHMVTDHSAANAKLAAIMRSEGMTVPAAPDAKSQATLTRLQGLSGRAFNRAYMNGQVHAHRQMQILMQSEANAGKDPRMVAFAKTTLSAVDEHLAMAKTDLAQLRSGGAAAHGAMGGTPTRGSSASGAATSSGSMPMASPMPMSSSMPMGSPMPMPMGSAMPMGSPMPMGSAMPIRSPMPMPSPSMRP